MITKEQAVAAGDSAGYREFWHVTITNADGTPVRCRANGKCHVWKTRPEEFRLPVKYGLRTTFYIQRRFGGGGNYDKWVTAARGMLCQMLNLALDTPDEIVRDRMIDRGHSLDEIEVTLKQ